MAKYEPMGSVEKHVTGTNGSVLDTPVTICWVNNCRDTNPVPAQVQIKELVAQFRVPQTNRGTLTAAEYEAADKQTKKKEKDGLAFIPVVFKKPNTRAQEDVREVTAFVLDFDGGVARAEFESALKSYCYIAYTTYSHSASEERWRVVIFYASPASESDHHQVYAYFARLFQGRLDACAKKLNQIWYSPACPPDAGALFCCFANDAPLLVTSEIAASEREREKAASTKQQAKHQRDEPTAAQQGELNPAGLGPDSGEMARVKDALRNICPDDRDVWIRMGMALKQAKQNDGYLSVWLEWSKASKKYDEAVAISNWNSFKAKEGGVTLGSLYYLARQAGWIPASVDDANAASVAELNADHFVARENGKTCVFREKRDSVAGRTYLERMALKDVTDFFRNRKVLVGKKQVGLGQYWLDSPDRRQYDDVVFAPNHVAPGSYNLWRGFLVKPRRGGWPKMQYHIKNVICAGDETLYQYVLNWMARAIQYPECPAEVALVLQGARGAGKGSFVHPFGQLFGQHYLQVTQARHLVGNFNSHLRDCVVLFADEAFWAGDRQGENVLKALVTEPTIMIEPKGINSFSVRNFLHIIIATNNDWAVPAGERERRYCVLKVSDIHAQDTAYFAALRDETDNGGLAAMLYDLQGMDLSGFNVRKVPYTTGLMEQVLRALEPEMRWWLEVLQRGAMWQPPAGMTVHSGDLTANAVPHTHLQAQFAAACHGMHPNRGTQTSLGMFLPKVMPPDWLHNERVSIPGTEKPERCYILPPLAVAREHFVKLTGLDGVFDEWEI